MKTIVKAVLVATVLMGAQAAMAHDATRYDANGKPIMSDKSWSQRKSDQVYTDRMDRRTDDAKGNHSFMGMPTQQSSNLKDDRDELRSIRPSH